MILRGYNIRAEKIHVSKRLGVLTLNELQSQNQDGLCTWNNKLIDIWVAFTGEDGGEDDIVDTITGSCRFWTRLRRRVKA